MPAPSLSQFKCDSLATRPTALFVFPCALVNKALQVVPQSPLPAAQWAVPVEDVGQGRSGVGGHADIYIVSELWQIYTPLVMLVLHKPSNADGHGIGRPPVPNQAPACSLLLLQPAVTAATYLRCFSFRLQLSPTYAKYNRDAWRTCSGAKPRERRMLALW